MLCIRHNSENSALQGIWTRKDWKNLSTLILIVFTQTYTEANEWLTANTQLDKIISQGANAICKGAGLGPIPFLITGVHHNLESKRKLWKATTPKMAEGFRPKKEGYLSYQKLLDPKQMPHVGLSCSFCMMMEGPAPTWDPCWAAAPLLLSITPLLSSVCC